MSTTDGAAVREFHIGFSDDELADLRRRIEATRWPERETVSDDSQGIMLATIQDLAGHWARDYDWRRCEVALNELLNFITEMTGSTSTSSTSARSTTTPCHSSSPTAGPDRSWSS
jgi:hypothetical protein